MGTVSSFPKVKGFIGIITKRTFDIASVYHQLNLECGPLSPLSSPFSYHHTPYYQQEMGEDLVKYFVDITPLLLAESMSSLKLKTQVIEDHFKVDQRRQVNLDPGWLTLYQVGLLSTKPFSHRLCLQDGIYGEVTLLYQRKQWVSLPWTYPDFTQSPTQDYLSTLRTTYQQALED